VSYVTESSELQRALAMKREKLNIVLMHVVPLMVPIIRFTEHIRNFVRSSV